MEKIKETTETLAGPGLFLNVNCITKNQNNS
jgi:hypothetical protein